MLGDVLLEMKLQLRVELAFDARFRIVEAEWYRYLREDLPRAGSLAELPAEDPFG